MDCDDTNTLSYSCNGDDIDVHSYNFSRYLESDNKSSISEEVLNYLYMLINNDQQATPELTATLKVNIGKMFTVLLIKLIPIVYLKYPIRNYGAYQQYAFIIGELSASTIILTSIKANFCTDLIEKYKDDFLQYVLLPILLDRAKKIADILRNIGQQSFQESVSPNKMDTLLLMYDRIARVIERMKDIDCRSYHELINDIQQLRASLDNVDKVIIGGGLGEQMISTD